MNRRDVLLLTGVSAIGRTLFGSSDAAAAVAQSTTLNMTRLLRIYADADGNSHCEDLVIAPRPTGQVRLTADIPAISVSISESAPNAVQDWHPAPRPQFAIALAGELEVEVSGGVKRRVRAGELVFLEDQRGRGHITRLFGSVTNLFIRVDPKFDVVAWTRGLV